jgi:hypothetical protein
MKRTLTSLCFLFALNAASTITAQGFYPDFALVVQLPSYETFLTNSGSSALRVDGYQITSQSGSLNPAGWVRLGQSGPAVVAALGSGADQFFSANPSANSLTELNPLGSATWPPGRSWSIGFPFNTNFPNAARDAVFRFSSPDGFVLTGGTVVPPGVLFPAALVVIPEPSSGALCVLAIGGLFALRLLPSIDSVR